MSPLNSCPNNHVLNTKETNFLMFNTIVTVTAEALADKMLTPEIHASCVAAFTPSKTSPTGSLARGWARGAGKALRPRFKPPMDTLLRDSLKAGVEASREYCLCNIEENGRKNGRERKWE